MYVGLDIVRYIFVFFNNIVFIDISYCIVIKLREIKYFNKSFCNFKFFVEIVKKILISSNLFLL